MRNTLPIMLMFSALATAAPEESFDAAQAGPLQSVRGPIGTWSAQAGQAEIIQGKARTGQRALRIHGGSGWREVTLELPAAAKQGTGLIFHAERWTARAVRIPRRGRGQWPLERNLEWR